MTKQYHPEEILVIEVNSDCSNLALGRHVVNRGVQRLEILGRELAQFQKAIEPDAEVLQEAEASWNEWCDSVKEKASKSKEKNAAEQAEQQISKAWIKRHPYARFRAIKNRDVKPLRSLSVIESKGKRVTPRNIQADTLEALRVLLERFAEEKSTGSKGK